MQPIFDINQTIEQASGRIRLGLCCINNQLNTLKKNKITLNRTCIRRTFTPKIALEKALANVSDIIPMLEWNEQHNIRNFRLSSDMFPHINDPEVESYTVTPEIVEKLREAGAFANKLKHRITMHPGQHNVVGTPNQAAFDNTVADLSHHAWILDTMGIGDEGVLCIHLGGSYGDMESTLHRWIDQFDDLPHAVKRRLAIENTERNGNVRECLTLAQECNIPMIYDSHHHRCNCKLHPEVKQEPIEDVMWEIIDTWHGVTPLMHISTQDENKRVGAHAEYIDEMPIEILQACACHNINIDIDVEAKGKEAAIFDLYNKYPKLF
jgi:UV DNA damage endonuclease